MTANYSLALLPYTHLELMPSSTKQRKPMRKITALLVSALAAFSVSANAAEPEFLNSGKVLDGQFPFSEAVKVGDTLYLSGQVGLVPATQKLAEGGIKAESHQTMQNIKTVLEANGYGMDNLVKCTAFLADMDEWPVFNEVYKSYLTEGKYPARSAFGANGLALDARVEVECIAAK